MAKKGNRQKSRAARKEPQQEPAIAEMEEAAVSSTQRSVKQSRSQVAAERIEEEYAYITNDLRRVFILAAILFALLIAVNLVLSRVG